MNSRILTPLLFLSLLLASCNLPLNSSSVNPANAPQIWLDQPLNRSEGRVGEIVPVMVHARDGDGAGISDILLYINGQLHQTEQTDSTLPLLIATFDSWAPQSEGVYLVEVEAMGEAGASRRASAWVYVSALPTGTPHPTITPTKIITTTPTRTPTPSLTPTRTATTTPSVPIATGNQDVNCREGAGTAYAINGTLFANQSRIIEGRNADWTWWWIQHPNASGAHCWVSDDLVSITGDTSSLPIIDSPPLPPKLTDWSGLWTMWIEVDDNSYETVYMELTQIGNYVTGVATGENFGSTWWVCGFITGVNSELLVGSWGDWKDCYKDESHLITFQLLPGGDQFIGNWQQPTAPASAWCGSRNGKPQPSPCFGP